MISFKDLKKMRQFLLVVFAVILTTSVVTRIDAKPQHRHQVSTCFKTLFNSSLTLWQK
jgi:hypothetical protein